MNKKLKQSNGDPLHFSEPYASKNLSYSRNSVQGFLIKKIGDKNFFQKKEFKRYFVLDNMTFKMHIYHTNDPTSKQKTYTYSNIKSVTVRVDPKNSMRVQERWSFMF